MSEKIIVALILASVSIITVILTFVLKHFIKKDGKNKKTNENSNKGGEITNPLQIITDGGGKTTINIYHNPPNKDSITSPKVEIDKNEKKNQEKEIEKKEETNQKDPIKTKEQSEKGQKMSRQEFEELLMKVKFIAFGVMGNIKWDKIKPLKFRKNEEGKETALLMFKVEKKGCFIEFIVSEEDKQRFLKTNTSEIVERFITQRLVDYGINGYLDDKCPECKQNTLTKTSVINDPNEEAIACNLCGWAGFMITYKEYLNDKKHNRSLEFPEWLDKRTRWWEK